MQCAQNEIFFYLNGKRVVLKDVQPEQSLLQYLRSSNVRLMGTKLGCGEGGCGACTVMVSRYDKSKDKINHFSVNACLFPLCAVDGSAVTTVEGIGSVREGLDPVQEKIAGSHGSQCGFCTPGIVMALYAYLRENPGATAHQIEENLDGNLCRCTGYRPILDAAKTFASDHNTVLNPPPTSAVEQPQFICPSTGQPCSCAGSNTEMILQQKSSMKDFIFPAALKKYDFSSLQIVGTNCTWFRPRTLDDLLDLKSKYPEAKIVTGNSEVGIEARFKGSKYRYLISPVLVPELNEFRVTEGGLVVGAAVTLNSLKQRLEKEVTQRPKFQTRIFTAVLDQLKWFAGNQIRNVACLGGNIATASPISDLNPLWVAAKSTMVLAAAGGKTRTLCMRDIFLSYRKIDMGPEEVILSILIPFTGELEFFKAYKQSRRRDDDIAIVSAAFRVKFEKKDDHYIVESSSLSFGGMAPTTVSAKSTEVYLCGRKWDPETLNGAYSFLEKDLPLPPNAPGGMIEYRRSLTTSFFFKYYYHVLEALELHMGVSSSIPDTYKSILVEHSRPVSRGEQTFVVNNGLAPVGNPVKHQSADKQVTGEAVYVDDIVQPPGGLYGYFVLSTKAHAKILSVDPSKALTLSGVKGYISAADIPGQNQIGPVFKDEQLFATDLVSCWGYPIGLILADSQELAAEAARLVEIKYEELTPIITIADAIAAQSFFPKNLLIERGNVEKAFGESEFVIHGEFNIGGQEHFYLEPQSAFAIPVETTEIVIYSSTQNPTKTQDIIAQVLNLPMHQVVVKIKRIGGGFGGKETRSIYVAAAAAVAASKLRSPVRVVLDRDIDMATSGGRNPFYIKYKVGFNKSGEILALEAQLYANGGNSHDLSLSVMERALCHFENAYFIPNIRCRGVVCKTHIVTNTAFRGFGGPQGMLIAETCIDAVARTLQIPSEVVRFRNFYQEGQATPFGQIIRQCHIQRLWKQLLQSSDFENRRKSIQEFNNKNRWRKRGIEILPVKFGMSFNVKFMNQAGALVHVYTDGTVLVNHGGIEMGQGLHVKIGQIAAQAFNIPLESVFISETSTDKVPNSSPTAASVSSDLNGYAVLNACNEIKARLEPIASKMPGASFVDIVRAAYFQRISLSATGFFATPDIDTFLFDGQPKQPFAYFNWGAAVSEVEIDTLTGDHQVLRVDILMDVGNSLNPVIDIGQIEGAFVQGMGWFTTEEVVIFDNGFMFTRGPSTYKIPSFNSIPLDMRVSLLKESANNTAIHSSKGVGEPPLFLGCSVYFAIKDAISYARDDVKKPGFFRLDAPASCERIRMSCEDTLTAQFTKS